VTFTQINNADITSYVNPVNQALQNPAIAHYWNPYTAAGRAALDATIATQAQIIAYIDDFRLLMFLTLAAFPLLLFFRRAQHGDGDHMVAH